ncbi:MAG: anaerobic ribonucleoside-triphosphate reductase activating protein [Caldiserica bacterium]|nr:anaerobic ribonucleoside-triphosphate reductase activating protein [Caldisericota bacterium]
MRIAHFLGLSLIDYPGKVAAVVWTVGCNLRCPFCYNPELVLPERAGSLELLDPWEVLAALAERAGFVQGLAITGGEPTLQGDLVDFATEAKKLRLQVKLDTNGTNPEVLEELLGKALLDYIALDIKAPFGRYAELAGIPRERAADVVARVKRSLEIVRELAPAYELRTTLAPPLTAEDVREIRREIGDAPYFLQRFIVPEGKGLVGLLPPAAGALGPEEIRRLAAELSCGYRL